VIGHHKKQNGRPSAAILLFGAGFSRFLHLTTCQKTLFRVVSSLPIERLMLEKKSGKFAAFLDSQEFNWRVSPCSKFVSFANATA